MSEQFDVAIMGGGPAGTSAAISAARAGMCVLLLDRDTFPRPRVCGEFVSSESLALLSDLLGGAHPLLTQTLPIAEGRLFIGKSVTDTHIDPPGRSIPRYELDHALWQAASSAGVFTHAGTPVTQVKGAGPFTIHTPDKSYETRSVIHAAGRWSSLLGKLEPPPGPKWIGMKAHYATGVDQATVDLYFFPGGYCGVQPVREGVINVCAMVRSDVANSLEEITRCHPALQVRSLRWSRITEPVATAPLIHSAPLPVQNNVFLVGDAAGFIDPFLGDGISLALQTGALAARAVASFVSRDVPLAGALDIYANAYRHDILPCFQHAARLRRVLSSSQPFQAALTGLLKVPHITEWLLRKTRPKVAPAD